MEKQILRLENEFWRKRTDTGELADAERDALRAYLDKKGFRTATSDDNLIIVGELTWKEVFERFQHVPIFYTSSRKCRGDADGGNLF
jgi:hypothetical protein